MKILLTFVLLTLSAVAHSAAYIKFDGIDGESKAVEEARAGYATLSSKHPKLHAADGQERTLGNGYFLREDGRLLEVKNGRTRWISSPRDAASGLPTGKRQHKPVSVTKPVDKATPLLLHKADCVNGEVVRGEHKGKRCEHRGHVTVLK